MTDYIVRRILLIIPVILGVSLLVFILVRVIPGDPAAMMMGENAQPAEVEQLRIKLGLDKPLIEQLVTFLKGLVTLELGESLRPGYGSVSTLLMHRFPATIKLTLVSLAVAVLLAFPLGISSAVKVHTPIDSGSMFFALLGVSIPNFWLGPMLILIFCLQLDWLPTPIYGPEGVTSFILPAITLGTALAAILTRMIRSSLLDVIRSPYIMTAYAKGASHCRAILRHALRNALIPVVTILGLQFGALLGGSIITETIFSWPGIGKELIDAITARDYPVIQGCVLLIAFSYVLVNLLTDLTYGYLDPRIQLNTRSKHGILAAGKLQAKWMILAGIIVMLFFTGVFIEFFTRYGVLTLLISLVTLTGKAFFHLITFLSSRFFQVLLLLTIPVFIIRWRKNNEQSWRRFARNHFAVAGLCITVLFLITGIIGPSIAPYDALKQDLQNQQQSPTWQHPFGTDDAGRDLFSRVLDGSKVSVKVGVTVTIFSVLVGTLIGILSGMFGGWIDECVMRFVDILLAFPGILLAIAMMAIFREKFSGQELTLLIMALCVMGWVGYARLARAQILSLKESDFVAAARALGVSNRRLILQHFVPNIAAPIIVQATLGMAGVIIAEAGLSFLGLGIGPPHPSWGNILNTGTDVMMLSGYPYMAIFPGIFIMITVMGLNFLGDGIRDALDPQSQPRK